MNRLTRGAVESQIADAAGKFQREQQGRGPADIRTFVFGDQVLVRCRGIFTPTELRLIVTDEGRRLVRSARQEIRSINRFEIEQIVSSIVGCRVLRSYCDVNVEAGEQVEIFIFEADIEQQFSRTEPERLIRSGASR